MIQRYRLPHGTLTALCAGAGSADDIALLWSGQLSTRLLHLKAIIDTAGDRAADAARLGQLEGSYRCLVEVQRYRPLVVTEILLAPQVGAWAASCLRRLTSNDPDGDDRGAPLWIDLAQLGAIAAAAAIRAGADVHTGVPARDGSVTLPTLGRLTVASHDRWDLARFALSAGLATVDTGRQRALLPRRWPADAPGWEPLRRLRTRAAGDGHALVLDDLDPCWRCFRLPVDDRLRPAAVQRWQGHFAQAWDILATRHPERLSTVRACVAALVPLAAGSDPPRRSASSRHAAGAVASSEPVSGLDLAMTLVHEVQHFKLNALHDLTPLYHTNAKDLYYSPWRPDPRPLAGLLHGIYAFLGVAEFMRRERASGHLRDARADLEFACCTARLQLGCQQAQAAIGLTPLGEKLVASMSSAAEKLPDEEFPGHVQRQAKEFVAAHRAEWQRRYDADTSISQSVRR